MPNLVQASGQASQIPLQDNRIGQVPVTQTISSLPPLAQSNMQTGLLPRVQEGLVSNVPQNTLARNQFSAPLPLPIQPRAQLPQHTNELALQQPALPGSTLVSTFPPPQSHSSSSLSIRPQIQVAGSSFNQQMQLPSLKKPQAGAINLGYNTQIVRSNATMQPSLLPHQSLPETRYQVHITLFLVRSYNCFAPFLYIFSLVFYLFSLVFLLLFASNWEEERYE